MDLNKEVQEGKIFIYPTDTVYGLGCNALDKKAVDKIKTIKKRDKKKPISIIAPSFDWIEKNCKVDFKLKKYLPGPYTLILKKKNKDFLNHISPTNSLGIRIPDSYFCFQIQKTEAPFITTSVNKSGEKPATSIKQVSKDIKNKVDIIVNAGKLSGKPSILIRNGKKVKRN